MLLKALAFDFDGTLASEDKIGRGAREALERARRAGLRLILVTGRTFFELTRVCDCLELFDAVVAENGAVLYYPGSAMLSEDGPAPPDGLLRELDRRGVAYLLGRVILSVTRGEEAAVHAALTAAGVSRDLVYNRGFLMLLPEGIDKGTGVRRALRFFRLSFQDVLAFGDAENDLPLFAACGWSACPQNAEPALRESADWVFPGYDADSVAAAISGPVLTGLPMQHSRRHRIHLGWQSATSEPVSIPARAVNVLIHGDSASGKSWLAGALIERLVAAQYAVCIIDPEGDYQVFGGRMNMTWAEVSVPTDVRAAVARLEHDPGASIIVDLSCLPHAGKVEAIGLALNAVRDLRRRVGRPHWVVLDEAHYSLHGGGVGDEDLRIKDRGFCLVTYRPSWLRQRVIEALDVVVSSRTTDPSELAFVASRFLTRAGHLEHAKAALAELPPGAFVVLQPDAGGPPMATTFVAAPRETAHVRHLNKYADAVVAPDRRFFFRDGHGRRFGAAESLQAFRRLIGTIHPDVLGHHAGHGDFSRWVLGVFGDQKLARQLGKAEARWRRGELVDLQGAIDRLIAVRYGGDEQGTGEIGREAITREAGP